MKGLRASIYKENGRDYSNGGISSRVNEVTIVGRDIDRVGGAIFEPTVDAPAVVLVRRTMTRNGGYRRRVIDPATGSIKHEYVGETYEYVHAEPLQQHELGLWLMNGGTYIATSDSRFNEATGGHGPIALHDRYEG